MRDGQARLCGGDHVFRAALDEARQLLAAHEIGAREATNG
jgi:hypothetical protein